jgi:hypothetical protein
VIAATKPPGDTSMLKIETLARELVESLNDDGDILCYTRAEAALAALTAHLAELEANRGAFADDIQAARDERADDDTEIDDEPLVSPSENGTWVRAWVFVTSDDNPDFLDE